MGRVCVRMAKGVRMSEVGVRSLRVVRLAIAVSLGVLLMAGASARAATAISEHPGQLGTVKPHAYGSLDCNGFSPIQRPVKANLVCRDVRDSTESDGRFYE